MIHCTQVFSKSRFLRSLKFNGFFYLPYLSSIHKRANYIAMFWTVCPHTLGSYCFRDVWATCLLHKDGGVPLSALPKGTTCEPAGLFTTTSLKCRAPSRDAVDIIVVWYDTTRGMNPKSTDCEANALTTTPWLFLYSSNRDFKFYFVLPM